MMSLGVVKWSSWMLCTLLPASENPHKPDPENERGIMRSVKPRLLLYKNLVFKYQDQACPIWLGLVYRQSVSKCWLSFSVTRLSNFLHFGQLFKADGNNYFASSTLLGNFCKGVKIVHFSSEIIFGQLLWTFWRFLLVTLLYPFTNFYC